MCQECDRLRHDIQAYRGSLGYPVPGDHDGRLSDGTTPHNGLAEAVDRDNRRLRAELAMYEHAVESVREHATEPTWSVAADGWVMVSAEEYKRLQKLSEYCSVLRGEVLSKVSGWIPHPGEPISGRGAMTYYGEHEEFESFYEGMAWLNAKFDADFPPPQDLTP